MAMNPPSFSGKKTRPASRKRRDTTNALLDHQLLIARLDRLVEEWSDDMIKGRDFAQGAGILNPVLDCQLALLEAHSDQVKRILATVKR